MTPPKDILPPRYRNPRRIGLGGMGEIYRAEDESLGRTVAIKVLAERYARDDSLRQRFTREALAAARLSAEPNTVTIFDVGEWHDRPFIVMEHLDGGSLEDRLQAGGRPSTEEALAWLGQAAAALDAAHRHGVVHRDVKPGNLLLDAGDGLRVADFGIASAAGLDSLTMTGTVLGTAGYLSPEQAQGERATPASDRYALGVVAYELLSGHRPFESESPTAEAAAHVNAEVPPLSPQLDPVFQRALAKDPSDRFETASQFVAALGEALEDGAATTSVLPATATRRSVLPLVAGLVIAAVLAGAGLAALLTRDDGQATARASSAPTSAPAPAPPPPAPPPPAPPPPPPPPPPAVDAADLTDQATQALEEGDYARAEQLARRALAVLQGTGEAYEAYAEYDLGAALVGLNRCDEALQHLDRSQELQGKRKEIDRARRACKKKGRGQDRNNED
ncbi:MAG TPA: serine/threonine-protein kinase [Gaiellaceae bacterium]|nr:serine/threonine-protein kinase [Gaiellaceae bacterium]